jgi:hypothetical protein
VKTWARSHSGSVSCPSILISASAPAEASNAAAPSELRSNDKESFIVKKGPILPAVIGK